MSSAICFNSDQSKILSSVNGLGYILCCAFLPSIRQFVKNFIYPLYLFNHRLILTIFHTYMYLDETVQSRRQVQGHRRRGEGFKDDMSFSLMLLSATQRLDCIECAVLNCVIYTLWQEDIFAQKFGVFFIFF